MKRTEDGIGTITYKNGSATYSTYLAEDLYQIHGLDAAHILSGALRSFVESYKLKEEFTVKFDVSHKFDDQGRIAELAIKFAPIFKEEQE